MDYRKMDFPAIYEWCEKNGQLKWLEAKVNEEVETEVYPFVTIVDAEGNKKRKYDKTATPKVEKRPISFLSVKDAFVEKFMPEIKPVAKPAKKTMRDWFK